MASCSHYYSPMSPPPLSLGKALRYPDATEWSQAHDAELYQLDENGTIHWLSPKFLPPIKPIPITMGTQYKWTTGYQLLKQKARAAFRGDLMIPYIHQHPAHFCAPMVSKATLRLLFGLKGKLGL